MHKFPVTKKQDLCYACITKKISTNVQSKLVDVEFTNKKKNLF